MKRGLNAHRHGISRYMVYIEILLRELADLAFEHVIGLDFGDRVSELEGMKSSGAGFLRVISIICASLPYPLHSGHIALRPGPHRFPSRSPQRKYRFPSARADRL